MQSASKIHPQNLPIANPATSQSRAVARRTPSPEQNKLQPGVSFERLAELWKRVQTENPNSEVRIQQKLVTQMAMQEYMTDKSY